MSPFASHRFQNSCAAVLWCGSVVRIKCRPGYKSSFFVSSLNFAAYSSTYCWGVALVSSALRWILSPCSSVPVLKNTSSPVSERYRATMSACTISSAKPICGSAFTYGSVVVREKLFFFIGKRLRFFLINIRDKLLYGGGDGDREQYSEEARQLGAHYQSEDDQQRRHADDLFDHHRVYQVRLKLLHHQVEPADQQERGKASVGKSDSERWDGGEYLPEHGDKLEEPGDNRKQKRVRDAQYGEPQIQQHADDEPEHQLTLHPLTYLVLTALPQVEHVGLPLAGRYDAQKVVDAGFLHGKVKGKHDDEHKRGKSAEERRQGGKHTAGGVGEGQGNLAQQIGRGYLVADIAPRQQAMRRVGDIKTRECLRQALEEVRRVAQERRHKDKQHAKERPHHGKVHEYDREHAVDAPLDQKPYRRLDGRRDDHRSDQDEDYVAQKPQERRKRQKEERRNDAPGGDMDVEVARLFHTPILHPYALL